MVQDHVLADRSMAWGGSLLRGVVIAATLDTKFTEIGLLREELHAQGIRTIVIDCGILGDASLPHDITSAEVAALAGTDLHTLREGRDREAALPLMMRGLQAMLQDLLAAGLVDGYLGIGGGTNAALAAAAFRQLPFGLPKMLVSTVVSGNTAPFVGYKDVVLVHSVVDVLGLGSYLREVMKRSAMLMAALVADAARPRTTRTATCVGVTAFGSTTGAANQVFHLLAAQGMDVLTFHARGTGGRAAEHFMRDGRIDAMLDLTLTEITDEMVGGSGSAGPERLDAAASLGLPQVLLPGAIDMVNFGPRDAMPARFQDRLLVQHTPWVTLMRANAKELWEVGRFVADKLACCRQPPTVLIPTRGFSAYDAPGGVFHDPHANQAFVDALRSAGKGVLNLIEIDAHINDQVVADVAVSELLKSMATS